MNKLSLGIQYLPAYATLKKRAWDAAVTAVRNVREEASYNEMVTAAVESVLPMNREQEHQEACERILRRVSIYDATRQEQEAAQEEVRKALEIGRASCRERV